VSEKTVSLVIRELFENVFSLYNIVKGIVDYCRYRCFEEDDLCIEECTVLFLKNSLDSIESKSNNVNVAIEKLRTLLYG